MPKKDFYENCPTLKAIMAESKKCKKLVIEVEDCSSPTGQLVIQVEDCSRPARQVFIPVNKPVYEWETKQGKPADKKPVPKRKKPKK